MHPRATGRRPTVAAGVLCAVLVLSAGAGALALRGVRPAVEHVTLEDRAVSAAQQNAVERRDEWLTALAEVEHGSDQAFEAAADALVDRAQGDVVLESGGGRLTWRTHVLGDAHNGAGGFLARSRSAQLCYDVTADRHAEELVVLTDSVCPHGVEALGDVDADLAR